MAASTSGETGRAIWATRADGVGPILRASETLLMPLLDVYDPSGLTLKARGAVSGVPALGAAHSPGSQAAAFLLTSHPKAFGRWARSARTPSPYR